MTNPLQRWRDQVGDAHVLSLVRVAIGVFLFWHALALAEELRAFGYFGDAFHLPYLPETMVPSRGAYLLIVAARLLLAVLVTVGHKPRASLFGSAILGFYVLLSDRLQFHHNRYSLLCYALLLAFAPCDRAFSITQNAYATRSGATIHSSRPITHAGRTRSSLRQCVPNA